jgi:hypothetical protein
MVSVDTEPAPVTQDALYRLAAMDKGRSVGTLVSAIAIFGIAVALILLVVLINREQSRVTELRRANAKIAALTLEAKRANERARVLLLASQNAVSPAVANALREIDNVEANLDNAAAVRAAVPGRSPADATIAAASSAVERDQVLTRGLASGWDLDIFWCPNSASEANYAAAARVANALATAASEEMALRPGVRLGRVRLRAAPPARQEDWAGEKAVVFDPSTGDREAAEALRAYIKQATGLELDLLRSTGARTPYYLSVKSCRLAS